MKKLFGAVLALCASVAFGATFVPVQLLNPTGSSSGQAIVSTGASSAPAWGGVGLNGIAAIAANTVVANFTGSSAAPTAFAMPSCTAGILQYTSGTGISCGNTVSTLTATGAITPSQTAGIVGTTTNNNANAGSVGEYPATPCNTTGTSMTSATPVTLTSCSIGAGDWDVWAVVQTAPAASTTTTQIAAGLSTTTNAFQNISGTSIANEQIVWGSAPAGPNGAMVLMAPVTRFLFASSTTVFCIGQATFAVSTMTGGCAIMYRRRR